MFKALSLVLASAGSGLVAESPSGPVVGVGVRMCGPGSGDPESSDLVAGQRDQTLVLTTDQFSVTAGIRDDEAAGMVPHFGMIILV